VPTTFSALGKILGNIEIDFDSFVYIMQEAGVKIRARAAHIYASASTLEQQGDAMQRVSLP
jgi:hypothetical protein